MTGNFESIMQAKAYAKRNGLRLIKTEKAKAWYMLERITFTKAYFEYCGV